MNAHLDYFDFDASDEGLHQPGPEPQWNESVLFHLVEKDGQRALLLRIGRRVNEGHAEMTVAQLAVGGGSDQLLAHLPEKLGLRFSKNARNPSCASRDGMAWLP